jgi:hypothetical protein
MKLVDVMSADPATHTATVIWDPGEDPDLQTGVQGSDVDEMRSEYRYQRPGGVYSQWYSSDSESATLTSVNTGDSVNVQVRGYDQAGNVSAATTATLTIPDVTANASILWLAPMACSLGGCEGLIVAGAALGAIAYHAVASDGVSWDVKKVLPNVHLPLARATINDNDEQGPTQETKAEWEARQKREYTSKKRAYRVRHPEEFANGEDAHHTVPVNAKGAEYAREVMYKCGIDLGDDDLFVGLPRNHHGKTYSQGYFDALNKMLHRHDPDTTISPCDEFRDDPVHGIRATLKRIKHLLSMHEFPYT